jgi:hypothetical protein
MRAQFSFASDLFELHLSINPVCSDSLAINNKTSSRFSHGDGDDNHSILDENASDISGNNPSLIKPNDGGSFTVSVDDGSDKNEFDEPWSCLKPWKSTDKESSKSGSDDNCKPKALDVNELDDPLETDNVMWYGIAFTSSEYVESKLLKVLNDAHAPNFLYQDVLNWAKEANQLRYDFLPQVTT